MYYQHTLDAMQRRLSGRMDPPPDSYEWAFMSQPFIGRSHYAELLSLSATNPQHVKKALDNAAKNIANYWKRLLGVKRGRPRAMRERDLEAAKLKHVDGLQLRKITKRLDASGYGENPVLAMQRIRKGIKKIEKELPELKKRRPTGTK